MPRDIIVGRDKADKEKFGKKGLIYLGKSYVKMGRYTSLSNPIYMDIARSHVILVSGKRGSGKCLYGDTLITLADGSQKPIKELENNNEKVLSLNNELKISPEERTEFFSREVKKLLKIKLKSGKEIKLTPEHPLFTIRGWKPAEKLKVGSRIATPRKTNNFGNESLPNHEIKLLAYLLAEGHTKKIVLFSNSDKKIVRDFKKSLKKFDPSLSLVKERANHYRITNKKWETKIINQNIKRNKKGQFMSGIKNKHKKRSIRNLIERERMYGLLATEKYIPNKIMSLKKEDISLFLNRLFSCDGSIYKNESRNGWEIDYSSSSKKLIHQVHNLLLKFGILSKIRKKKINYNGKDVYSYELVLNPRNTAKFVKEIGFYGEKEKREEKCVKEISEIDRNPNIDTIPKELWDTYKPDNWAEIGRCMDYKHPKAMRERIRYAPSRQTLLQIAKADQNREIELLASSDIFWDEIVSIELLEGKFKVYDICVPDNHNFVANNIIVHNSYSLGVMAEELATLPKEEKENVAGLIFDTMGIFWTMKYANEKETELLEEWDLQPKQTPVRVFVPEGYYKDYKDRGLPIDKKFSIDPADLKAEDWVTTFDLNITDPVAVLIERIVTDLKEKKKSFSMKQIINKIKKSKEKKETKNSAVALFEAADSWQIFSKGGTNIEDMVKGGETSILDLSMYSSVGAFNVRALVIAIISRKLFYQRMWSRKSEEIQAVERGVEYLSFEKEREMPLVWLFIDEVHEFMGKDEETVASDDLIRLLREGRQPGISIVMATQQPGAVARDVMTQSDIILSHRVTAKPDVDSLNNIMQSYLLKNVKQYMDDLPRLKGSGIILDDNSERIYSMRVRPKFTWHGGEAPTSVKVEKRL